MQALTQEEMMITQFPLLRGGFFLSSPCAYVVHLRTAMITMISSVFVLLIMFFIYLYCIVDKEEVEMDLNVAGTRWRTSPLTSGKLDEGEDGSVALGDPPPLLLLLFCSPPPARRPLNLRVRISRKLLHPLCSLKKVALRVFWKY